MESKPEQATILIVDDSLAMLRLLQAHLEPAGYRVHCLAESVCAFETARRLLPDLILLDVMMPLMDGYTLCRELKADEETRLIPVVLVTILANREARLEGLEAGADDFLTQPVDHTELLARVRSLVRLRRVVQAERESDRLRAELAKQLAVERVRREEEGRRRAFYRDVVAAVTHGKLNLVERAELPGLLAGRPAAEGRVCTATDLSPRRELVAGAAAAAGMAPERAQDLVAAVGEALTNAVRHARGGVITIYQGAEMVRVVVADRGPGIAELDLPRAALMAGHSGRRPSLGYGFTLMLKLTDRLWLCTDPRGTTLILEMRLRAPSAEETLDSLLT
ncbi:MAG: response regulator [Armatimonadetes bacterium]|nr:response regulator [Armatimonadota bacterium]